MKKGMQAAVFLGCCAFVAAAAGAPAREWAVAVFPSGTQFTLEIAADPEKRRLGYMFREKVGPEEGMLFIFDGPDRHSMWMKNCKVPLDLIWLDEALRVVEIARDVPPCPEDGDCVPLLPLKISNYVLEVAAGVTTREGLTIGDRVTVLAEPELP